MKLTGCYIENFGILHQQSFDFTDGLNVFNKENGWGKSTFAAFLRAMLYGLDSGRKLTERKLYVPWQGGKFGGSLSFSIGVKSYRVERSFGASEKSDSFALYDTESGLLSDDYTKNLGVELFGIDKDSYTKSAYIPQGAVEIEIDKTSSISAKLSDLVESDNDMGSFDDAVMRLAKQKLVYDKKGGGLIAKLKDKITDIELEQKQCEEQMPICEELKKVLSDKKDLKKELKEERERLDAYALKLEKAKRQKELKNDREQAQNRVKSAEAFFKKIPDESELITLSKLSEEKKLAFALAKSSELSEDKRVKLSEYKESLSGLLDGDPHIEDLRNYVKDYSERKIKIAAVSMAEGELKRLSDLERLFHGKVPDERKIRDLQIDIQRVLTLKGERDTANTKLELMRAQGTGHTARLPLTISGILILLAGIALIVIAKQSIVGVATLAAGVALIAIACFIKPKKAIVEDDINETLSVLEKEENALKAEISEFLKQYGYEYGAEASSNITDIVKMSSEYERLLSRKNNAEAEKLKFEITTLFDKIKSDAAKYTADVDREPEELLRVAEEIFKNKQEYERLLQEQKLNEAAKAKSKAAADGFLDYVATFTEKTAVYEDISAAVQDIKSARSMLKIAEDKIASCDTEEDIAADDSLTEEDIDTRKKEIELTTETLDNELQSLQKRLDLAEEETGKIPELLTELESTKEDLENAEFKLKIITETERCLRAAKEKIAVKYMGSLVESFEEYKSILSAPLKAAIDIEFNIGVSDGGETHKSDEYSRGIRDLLGVCLRFSLVSALFSEESPVIVLDDPFVNLDEERLEAAKKLLGELSKKYQIIYFVCHESRE